MNREISGKASRILKRRNLGGVLWISDPQHGGFHEHPEASASGTD
jgi:hypothetical protein